MDIQRQATQINNIRFDRGADGGEVPLTKRRRVLERQIPVNPKTPPLSAATDPKHVTETRKIDVRDSPRRSYHEFMSFDQTEPATIAYDNSHNLYTIKKHKCDPDKKRSKAQLFKHSSLVSVQDMF